MDAFTAYAEKFRRDFKVNRNTVYGYATYDFIEITLIKGFYRSSGVGAYEIRGETNGVFIKYLKNRIHKQLPVLEILNKVFRGK